jgi:predicted DsbA family dithiol-disulfide isomerase
MGVEGFPCLVVGQGEQYALVTNGFRPIDGIIEALEKWLATQQVA